jgi:hypothetical protein
MQRLTLGDLKLGLKDMLHTRPEDLALSAFGELYLPMLVARREAINALPEAFTGGRPLAAELAEIDAHHDGLGGAIWFITEAVLRHPGLSPELREAAQAARAAFIPELSVLRKPYADEAIAAHDHRPDLARLADQLKMITVPGGKTLHTWVKDFLDDGDRLGSLLADRGQTTASVDSPRAAAALRSSTIGLLGRLRAAVQDEIAAGAKLPKGYEAKLFATFDELHKRREEANPRNATVAAEAPAATPDLALGDVTEK